jgi:hypothetical protein
MGSPPAIGSFGGKDADGFDSLGVSPGPFWKNPWTTVTISDVTYKGNCQVRSKIKNGIHKKKPSGQKHSQITGLGLYEADYIDLKFEIADNPGETTQWDSFILIKNIIEAETLVGNGVPIYHPALDLFGISSVYLLEFGIPEPRRDPPDILDCTIRMTQWAPPKKNKAKTVKASAADAAALGLTGPRSFLPPDPDAVPPVPGPPAVPQGAAAIPGLQTIYVPSTAEPGFGPGPTPAPTDPPSQSQAGPPASPSIGPNTGGNVVTSGF